jgi:hypothetical protein
MKKHPTKKYHLSGSDSWDDCLTEIFFLWCQKFTHEYQTIEYTLSVHLIQFPNELIWKMMKD